MQPHGGKVYSYKSVLQPWISKNLNRTSREKCWAWNKAKSTKKKKEWDRYNHLKRETRRANRQAYQQYTSKIISEDTTKNLWQLIKSKKCDTVGLVPLKKTSLTTNDSKTKANLLNKHYCSVFTTEDTNNLSDPEPSSYPAMPEIQVSNIGVFKLLKNSTPERHLVQKTSPAVFLRW